ncbi:MAG: hypothetical protein ACFBZ8_10355 [Opitutales bacterium]
MSSLLSNKQKRVLGQISREAWDALPLGSQRAAYHAAATEDKPLPSENQACTHWRREQQRLAVGESSLTRMRQEDYLTVKLHFEMLRDTAGRANLDVAPSRGATRTMAKLATDEQRRAQWKLDRELERGGFDQAYAESICRTQFKVPLGEATARQLWNLFYTIRNRANARKIREPSPSVDSPF